MLMTKENSSEILRKELKNYRTYAILKRRSEERIKELKNDSKNVRSPRTDRVGDNTSTYEFDLLHYVNLIDKEKEKEKAYSEMQAWIIEAISGIENRSLLPDIVRIFFRGENREKVAEEREVREDLLNRQLLKEFKKAVTPEQIKKYNDIKRKIERIWGQEELLRLNR